MLFLYNKSMFIDVFTTTSATSFFCLILCVKQKFSEEHLVH